MGMQKRWTGTACKAKAGRHRDLSKLLLPVNFRSQVEARAYGVRFCGCHTL